MLAEAAAGRRIGREIDLVEATPSAALGEHRSTRRVISLGLCTCRTELASRYGPVATGWSCVLLEQVARRSRRGWLKVVLSRQERLIGCHSPADRQRHASMASASSGCDPLAGVSPGGATAAPCAGVRRS
jgi:hypothetical protein